MITLNLKIHNDYKKVALKEELIFNAILSEHPKMIKSLIKSILPTYKINQSLFNIINQFIDFTDELISIYPGLIVRTGLTDFAVLFLEDTIINEEYMISLIQEYLYDVGNYSPKEVNINKFEVSKSTFLKATKNI